MASNEHMTILNHAPNMAIKHKVPVPETKWVTWSGAHKEQCEINKSGLICGLGEAFEAANYPIFSKDVLNQAQK